MNRGTIVAVLASKARIAVVCLIVVGAAAGGYAAGANRPPQFDFIGASNRALWKVDRHSGDAFLCLPARNKDGGYIVGSRCFRAEMPANKDTFNFEALEDR